MEKDFSNLDRNYKNTSINGLELEFHPGYEAPIRVEGFPFTRPDGRPCRIPEDIVKRCEASLATYAFQGAGEQIRFRTDSPYFGIRAVFAEVNTGNYRRSTEESFFKEKAMNPFKKKAGDSSTCGCVITERRYIMCDYGMELVQVLLLRSYQYGILKCNFETSMALIG